MRALGEGCIGAGERRMPHPRQWGDGEPFALCMVGPILDLPYTKQKAPRLPIAWGGASSSLQPLYTLPPMLASSLHDSMIDIAITLKIKKSIDCRDGCSPPHPALPIVACSALQS